MTMIVAIISSRQVLTNLGVEDYGIYIVVGGIIGMMGVINTILVSSTNRFIALEIGKKSGNVNKIFNNSLVLHLGLAILTIILTETIGLYYIHNFLNIPLNRIHDAVFVFHLSLLSVLFTVLAVPFNALMTSYEDFGFQAKISMMHSFLILIVSFLISIDGINKLRFYAVLVTLVYFLSTILSIIHVKNKYNFLNIRLEFDKEIFKNMFSFSIWMAIGTLAHVFKNQGSVILLNLFFGSVVNAAYGLALMVNTQINQFSQNVNRAFSPQITKNYANGNNFASKSLAMQSSRYAFFMLFIICIPVFIELDYIYTLWLKEPPQYTVEFSRWMLIESLFVNLNIGIAIYVFATGKVKLYQVFTNLIYMLNIPIAYSFFYLGFPPIVIAIGSLLAVLLMMFTRHIILNKLFNLSFSSYFFEVYSPALKVLLPILPLIFFFSESSSNFFGFVCRAFFEFSITLCSVWFLGLKNKEREYVRNFLTLKYSSYVKS